MVSVTVDWGNEASEDIASRAVTIKILRLGGTNLSICNTNLRKFTEKNKKSKRYQGFRNFEKVDTFTLLNFRWIGNYT